MKLLLATIFGLSISASSANQNALLLKELIDGVSFYEGFRPTVYVCAGGVETIGYGHTGKYVQHGTITKKEAQSVLVKELLLARDTVDEIVTVDLTPNQKAALMSFTFNLGRGGLIQLVNGKGRLNDGNYDSVAKYLPLYRKAGGKINAGLEKRRAWELKIWNKN